MDWRSFSKLVIAVVLLRPKLGTIDGRNVAKSLGRDLLAVILPVAAGLAIAWAFGAFGDGGFAMSSRWSAIVVMAVVGTVMAALYGATLWLLRSPELRGFVALGGVDKLAAVCRPLNIAFLLRRAADSGRVASIP